VWFAATTVLMVYMLDSGRATNEVPKNKQIMGRNGDQVHNVCCLFVCAFIHFIE
jgi:hypothetical protein